MWRAVAKLIDEGREHRRAMATWEAVRRTLPETTDPNASGLTICSVAFRAKRCLDLNHQLMQRLNPGAVMPEWLLFDNNTEPSEGLDRSDVRFTVVPASGGDFVLGYDHAVGIGELLQRVKTRFLLIQDPDCFVVRPDWIRDVTRHMAQHELGFFGTPINPRRHNAYRYFPYMVCMFIDLARVPVRDLCFVPDVWRTGASLEYQLRRTLTRIPKAGFFFRGLLTEQFKTNGWRIKAQYGSGERVKFECAQPVWDVADSIPPGSLKRWIHDLTPDTMSAVPKRRDYCSPRGFASMGAPDVAGLGWEEFVWQDRPFAFHVGSVHGQPGRYERQLEAVLRQVTASIPDVAPAHAPVTA